MPERIPPVTTVHFKAKVSAADGQFEGWASTPDVDSEGTAVAPGACRESLEEHRAAGTMPSLLWRHRTDEPIGKCLVVEESEKGLYLKGLLSLGTVRGREAHALMRDGALGLSISFQYPKADFDGRVYKKIRLREISLVPIPSNRQNRLR